MSLVRFKIGRALVHIGLSVMPDGPVKRELFALFAEWSDHARAKMAESAPNG